MIYFEYNGVWYNKKELIIILRHIADQIEKCITNEDLLHWKLTGEDETTKTTNVHCGIPMAEIQNCVIDGQQLEINKCRICGEEEEHLWN